MKELTSHKKRNKLVWDDGVKGSRNGGCVNPIKSEGNFNLGLHTVTSGDPLAVLMNPVTLPFAIFN